MQLFSHLQQILLGNEPFIVLIDVLEDSLDIFDRVVLAGLLGHQLDEFLETDLTSIVGVEHRHRHVDEGSSWLVATVLPDGFSQIQGCEHAIMVVVQKVKDLFVDLDVSDCAFCDDEFFGVEVDVLLGLSET